MLPHDELLHYGTKGMRWGVRRAVAKSLEKRAGKQEKIADFQSKMASKVEGKHPKIASAYRFSSNDHRDTAKDWRTSANKLRASANKSDKARAAKRQKKIDSALNKKFDNRTKQQHKEMFDRALVGAAVGVTVGTGGILMKVVGPTAEMFGKRLANFVGSKTAKKTGRVAAEATFDWVK